MCIRDRHSPVLEPFSEMITDTVDNHGIAKALLHFGPVSYTHLDVYKRQALRQPFLIAIAAPTVYAQHAFSKQIG